MALLWFAVLLRYFIVIPNKKTFDISQTLIYWEKESLCFISTKATLNGFILLLFYSQNRPFLHFGLWFWIESNYFSTKCLMFSGYEPWLVSDRLPIRLEFQAPLMYRCFLEQESLPSRISTESWNGNLWSNCFWTSQNN